MISDEQPEARVEVSPRPVRMGATPPDVHLARLIDGVRLAVIGVIVGVGLSVGFGVGDSLVGGTAAGLGSVAALVAAFKVRPVRKLTAALADWMIGR